MPSPIGSLEGENHPFLAPFRVAPTGAIGVQQVFDCLHPVEVALFPYLDHFDLSVSNDALGKTSCEISPKKQERRVIEARRSR
tara:strand:- start:325 stop:573 length:249 start_codon:yes stop_codon:yes gene_type:complete